MAQYNSLTTRHPNGVTNAAQWQTMGAAGTADPTWAVQYANDFTTFVPGDFTITTVTAGAPTQALQAADGGAILVTNTAGAADATYMQLKGSAFKITPTKALFFKIAGTLSAVNLDVFFAGLTQSGATNQGTITDGIYIAKATAVSTLTLNSVVGSVTTTVAFPTSCVLTAATYFELGFMVDYLGNVAGFWNPTTGSNPISSAQLAVQGASGPARGQVVTLANGAATTPALTTALLSPHFGLLNSSGVANTLSVDYLVASRER